jgi:cyclic pyranopterin phosphate synthase
VTAFVEQWRRRKSAAFDLEGNSTAGETVELELWGRPAQIYANANFSIYSAQACNARCRFCVEELRPASRGRALAHQRTVETDEGRYFAALEASLDALRPLGPTISITGGEPSKDPRLPQILALCRRFASKRRSLTTNGSGLLDVRQGRPVIEHIVDAGVEHLNISRAHPDHEHNARLMVFREGLALEQLREVVATAAAGGCRVRLSCVLVERAIDSLAGIRAYLDFAASIGVDNVIFRQLMHVDRETVADNFVVKFSDRRRTRLEPLLDQISADPQFEFCKQIVGYYYYVEVWRREGIDVVFEEANLAQLERAKRAMPGVIHELIFHPNAKLASTWQPWDGVLGPG